MELELCSYASLIQFRLKGNSKAKSVSKGLSKSFLAKYSTKLVQEVKMLFSQAFILSTKAAQFYLALHRPNVQLAPPTKNIHGI